MFQSQMPYRVWVAEPHTGVEVPGSVLPQYNVGEALVVGICRPVPNSTISRGSDVVSARTTVITWLVIGCPVCVLNSAPARTPPIGGVVLVTSKRQRLPFTSPA